MFELNTRILIVDDMTSVRKFICNLCKEIGFTDLTEAADGALAWEIVANAKPAFGLIISDWNMPNCTGTELLKRVRMDSRISATPFILMTIEAEKDQIAEAVKTGVSANITKPFTAPVLREVLQSAFQKLK